MWLAQSDALASVYVALAVAYAIIKVVRGSSKVALLRLVLRLVLAQDGIDEHELVDGDRAKQKHSQPCIHRSKRMGIQVFFCRSLRNESRKLPDRIFGRLATVLLRNLLIVQADRIFQAAQLTPCCKHQFSIHQDRDFIRLKGDILPLELAVKSHGVHAARKKAARFEDLGQPSPGHDS